MELANSWAVVTGASGGIGLKLCELLAAKGANVFGLSRSSSPFRHPAFREILCNVRNPQSVEDAFAEIENQTDRIDVLVNNAGLGYFGFMEEMSLDQWHELYETNVNGVFYCTRKVLPGMKSRQSGHIVNIASTAALEGMSQVAAYCGTKWAVKGISESLFREVRDYKVKVTCIYPGSTRTDFFRNSSIAPHAYMLDPADVAKAIVYAIDTPDNFHMVNLEVRPLQPKGPKS
jgi:NADP-dependent 3-hydroxy acid dehydrogenase YdfG